MRIGAWAALLMYLPLAVFAAHPLITEDTGTQGEGGWQLEITADQMRDGESRATQSAAVLSYGFVEKADVQVGLPYSRHQGKRDLSIDLKWRFHENGPLSLALKPGITLPTGAEERGLGAGRSTWQSLLILSYEPGALSFHTHAGYQRKRNTLGERTSLTHISGAIMYQALDGLKLIIDLSRSTNPDPAAHGSHYYSVLGAIYSIRKDLDLDAGVKHGRGEGATDRAFLFGTTLRW